MQGPIIVTGAAGFIGQALVHFLSASGSEVMAVDRVQSPAPGRSLIADLTVPGALDQLADANTTIFHLAASANVPASVDDPRMDLSHTFQVSFEVLETCRRNRCRLIFPSTASIFDSKSTQLPLKEEAFPRPSSPYAAAKLASEAYCFAYHRCYGLDVRIARLFSVYGVGMRRLAVHDIIRKIEKNPKEISILGDGKQVRDYLYIDDVVRGLVQIATDGSSGEDYNLASGSPVSVMTLAVTIARLMGVPNIRINPTGQTFPGDTLRWYADISKMKQLGFESSIGLEAGLVRTIEWLMGAGSLASSVGTCQR